MKLTQNAGKRVRVSQDWFWFYFWLDEKVARVFKPIVWRTKRKTNCFSTLKWKPLYMLLDVNPGNRLFASSLVTLFQNESECETFHMKMSSTCSFILMQIKVIFIWMVSHLGPIHTNPFSNENEDVLLRFQKDLRPHLSFSYRFRPSTLQRRSREKPHGSVCPPFWILTVEWSGARSFLF